jgi:putative zinc finger/helix-turn-helix YgiT family protein
MNPDQCHKCGAVAVTEKIGPFTVEHDGKCTVIEDRRMVCGSCGTISYRGEQISEHERAVAAAIREIDGLLSADELYQIRTKYRLKQTDMEQMLSTGPKTWTRWERGKVPQSKPTDKLIRAIADDPDLARRLMRQANVANPEAEAVFERFDRDARQLARAMLRAELRASSAPDLERVADYVLDRAIDKVFHARRQIASKAEAA